MKVTMGNCCFNSDEEDNVSSEEGYRNNSPRRKRLRTVAPVPENRPQVYSSVVPTKPKQATKNVVTNPYSRIDEQHSIDEDNDSAIPGPSGAGDAFYIDEVEILCRTESINKKVAENFIALLNNGCTLPFIARYRKKEVNFLLPVRLMEIHNNYQNICQMKKRMQTVIESLKKSNKLTPEIEKSLKNAHSLNEIEFIYAPLKTKTTTLAEKARALGLETVAIKALNGKHIQLETYCKKGELATPDKVETYITYVVADILYKDSRVLEEMRLLKSKCHFTIQSTLIETKKTKERNENTDKKQDSKSNPETYQLYFKWKQLVSNVKPHQVLALNRGEAEKILSVKVDVPDFYYKNLLKFCYTQWKSLYWVEKGLDDAYKRLIKPWLSRQIRSDLTEVAHKEAVNTFTSNLEKCLLTEPVKNKRIVGLDPGFRAGCKVGVIDVDGRKLDAYAIHPNLRNFNPSDPAAVKLRNTIREHRVELIGLGNGTACRETESWLNKHNISKQTPVVIVPEDGASIYSVSADAQKEHKNMDPNLISALSLARRVLDPLGELIKVDPKNLGVGLYQHDIPKKMLETALDHSVEKIVSLVGVDINTASHALLRRISGLNDGRAKKIIEYRDKNGVFKSRADVLKVPSIGKVTYQQCIGFLKILDGVEPLDSTIIHPESYSVAKYLAKKLRVNMKELNEDHFIETVSRNMHSVDKEKLSEELGTDASTIDLILDAFIKRNPEADIIKYCKPIYSQTIVDPGDVKEGQNIKGVVRNVVPFGCFVDCGVGDDGLIHSSNMGGISWPQVGDRVIVTVMPSKVQGKLQLKLVHVE